MLATAVTSVWLAAVPLRLWLLPTLTLPLPLLPLLTQHLALPHAFLCLLPFALLAPAPLGIATTPLILGQPTPLPLALLPLLLLLPLPRLLSQRGAGVPGGRRMGDRGDGLRWPRPPVVAAGAGGAGGLLLG